MTKDIVRPKDKLFIIKNTFNAVKKRWSILLLNVLIISTIVDGIIFELIGLSAIVLLLCVDLSIKINSRRSKVLYLKEIRFNAVILCIGVLYIIIQVLLLHLTMAQTVRLYGITKAVLALPIIWLCMRNIIANGIGVRAILPIIILMNYMNFVYMLSGIQFFNLFNGSVNYVGAIDIILFPFIMSWDRKIGLLQRVLFLISFIAITVFSGSRSVLLVALIMFIGLIFLEKNKRRKRLYLFVITLAFIIAIIAIVIGNDMVARAVSVFTNRSDAARTHLSIFAKQQFDSYSSIIKLLGSGNNLVISQQKPVHCFWWELLLTYGELGLAIWIIWWLFLAIFFMQRRVKYRKHIFLVVACYLIINYVQPFMTTGFLFQIVFAVSVLQLYLRGAMH